MNTAQYIKDMANKHGVAYVKTPNDHLAETFSYLSDNEIVEDNISQTLVALVRANIIDKSTSFELLFKYFNETGHNV